MRNCILSCLQGLQRYWAFMKSFDIGALRFEFWHKFFPPWHYYWKFLSVHCDRKLIIILDIWWIAFIKVSFLFFFPRISHWPLKSFLTKGGKEKKTFSRHKNDFPQFNCKPSSGIWSMEWCLKMKRMQRSQLAISSICSCQQEVREHLCGSPQDSRGTLSCICVPHPWFITRQSISGCKWEILKPTSRLILCSEAARGPCSLCPIEKGRLLLTAPVFLGVQGL